MGRLTKAAGGGHFVTDEMVRKTGDGYAGPAIEKLAKLEDMAEGLAARQAVIAEEMERLRAAGKTNTVRFKQLLADKLTNANIIALLDTYGCG